MGITNRDYYREPSGSSELFGINLGTMTQRLIVVTVIAFVLQIVLTVATPIWRINFPGMNAEEKQEALEHADELDRWSFARGQVMHESVLEEWGTVDPLKVKAGQVWRLLTYAFLHSREIKLHILFNMIALWCFGPLVEELWGRREFLAFYLAAAIFAGVCHVVLGLSVHQYSGALGASGAVMGVMMAFAMYYPRQMITVYFFTLEARFVIAIYVIWDGFPVLQMLAGRGGRGMGVAHAAHLGGLAFGFLYCALGWRLTGWLDRLAPKSSYSNSRNAQSAPLSGWARWWRALYQNKPKLSVYSAPPDDSARSGRAPEKMEDRDLERRVDAVLRKIKEVGEENITEDERNVLREAAQAYRRRNE